MGLLRVTLVDQATSVLSSNNKAPLTFGYGAILRNLFFI